MNNGECQFCKPPDSGRVIYKDASALIIAPENPHISKADGGHLIVYPKKHVVSRLSAGPKVMLELSYLSIVAAGAMKGLLGVEWFNFQENANWSLVEPQGPHMHVHIYGRSKASPHQVYGEALVLPRRAEVPRLSYEQFSEEEIGVLTRLAAEAVRSGALADFQRLIGIASSFSPMD
jgi:diadenosine tetraphosphate (Ap4A) HIT family hydrolase